ncbi:WD repeat, SAM and U-box domain-containing protein 1-like [Planoprotostelium fungivorum]|uniref:WD repeat, SAM and U-box domain-containing protein 1-like n=1 Tax=Planoprotostelium fungivorum TaxID=1890364 RepID=A0A2P6NK27_9EUKA|nr:WD repeat, SAM and U-box domain-containing protein 1-like [Planoprotostelium fungivorum]
MSTLIILVRLHILPTLAPHPHLYISPPLRLSSCPLSASLLLHDTHKRLSNASGPLPVTTQNVPEYGPIRQSRVERLRDNGGLRGGESLGMMRVLNSIYDFQLDCNEHSPGYRVIPKAIFSARCLSVGGENFIGFPAAVKTIRTLSRRTNEKRRDVITLRDLKDFKRPITITVSIRKGCLIFDRTKIGPITSLSCRTLKCQLCEGGFGRSATTHGYIFTMATANSNFHHWIDNSTEAGASLLLKSMKQTGRGPPSPDSIRSPSSEGSSSSEMAAKRPRTTLSPTSSPEHNMMDKSGSATIPPYSNRSPSQSYNPYSQPEYTGMATANYRLSPAQSNTYDSGLFIRGGPISTAPITSSSSDEAARSSTTSYATGYFVLGEQPSARQRKSYTNEHRPLNPNPLTIMRRDRPGEPFPNITSGQVTVKLVNREGDTLLPSKRNILREDSDDPNGATGSITKQLDRTGHSATFSLLVMETSEGNMFRLHFTVEFCIDDVKHEEIIMSRPFIVYARRRHKKAPIVNEMRPSQGYEDEETECWIKGRGFSETVDVMLNGRFCPVVDTAENLITVIVPPKDPNSPSTVLVEVGNRYFTDQLMASKRMTFTYIKRPTDTPKTEANVALIGITFQVLLRTDKVVCNVVEKPVMTALVGSQPYLRTITKKKISATVNAIQERERRVAILTQNIKFSKQEQFRLQMSEPVLKKTLDSHKAKMEEFARKYHDTKLEYERTLQKVEEIPKTNEKIVEDLRSSEKELTDVSDHLSTLRLEEFSLHARQTDYEKYLMTPLKQWSAPELYIVLSEEEGLDNACQILSESQIDGKMFHDMNEDILLNDLRINLKETKNIMRLVDGFKSGHYREKTKIESWSREQVWDWILSQPFPEEISQNLCDCTPMDGVTLLRLTTGNLRDVFHIHDLPQRMSIISKINELRESQEPTGSSRDIEEELMCAITHEIMIDPVTTEDGFTYERKAINEWFDNGHLTSPKTGLPLNSRKVVPNHTLRSLIGRLHATSTFSSSSTPDLAQYISYP